MNSDILKAKWSKIQGQIQEQWSKLTDDDMEAISGSKNKLLGLIQERYECTKEEAEKQWNKFSRNTLDFLKEAEDEGNTVLERVNHIVSNSPWKSIAVAAVVGLAIGWRL